MSAEEHVPARPFDELDALAASAAAAAEDEEEDDALVPAEIRLGAALATALLVTLTSVRAGLRGEVGVAAVAQRYLLALAVCWLGIELLVRLHAAFRPLPPPSHEGTSHADE